MANIDPLRMKNNGIDYLRSDSQFEIYLTRFSYTTKRFLQENFPYGSPCVVLKFDTM